MDQVHVDVTPEAPPAWATQEPKITPNQRSFLLALTQEREVKPEQEGKVDQIVKCLRISEDPEEFGMGKRKASELIEWFLKQPKKPKNEQEASERAGRLEDLEWQKPLYDLPPGRYAIENNDGELRFYQRWQGKGAKKDRFALYVMHGPYESNLPRQAQVAIAAKILEAGVRKCALRYGAEIGACSNCGRRLTNRISRELAIGPVCGGRMFGGDWAGEVKAARAAIVARGEDPDEELE